MTKDELKLVDESINAYKNTIRRIKEQIKELEIKKGGSKRMLRIRLFILKYLT